MFNNNLLIKYSVVAYTKYCAHNNLHIAVLYVLNIRYMLFDIYNMDIVLKEN